MLLYTRPSHRAAIAYEMRPEVETIELQQLYSGDCLALQVYKFRSQTPGPKAYIQANLHGAEIVGNVVIFRLIDWLATLAPQSLRGEVWLVPACNPMAANQRSHFFSSGRYNSYDGRDWNRIFWDFEREAPDLDTYARERADWSVERLQADYQKRIKAAFTCHQTRATKPSFVPLHQHYRQRLQSLSLDADYVIDIHSSSNTCLDYLYCFAGREESAPPFEIDLGLCMTSYDGDAFDEAFLKPWLALERAFERCGRSLQFDVEAWTLELGHGMKAMPASVERGVRGIQNYLGVKGLIQLPESPGSRGFPAVRLFKRQQLRKYYAPAGGTTVDLPPLGKFIAAGDRLYRLLTFRRSAREPQALDVCAERDGLVFDLAANQAANQGEYVLSIIEDL